MLFSRLFLITISFCFGSILSFFSDSSKVPLPKNILFPHFFAESWLDNKKDRNTFSVNTGEVDNLQNQTKFIQIKHQEIPCLIEHQKFDKKGNDNLSAPVQAQLLRISATGYQIFQSNTVSGRTLYNSPSYVDNFNKVKIPAWYTVNLPLSSNSNVTNAPFSLGETCYNLFDKDYWVGRNETNPYLHQTSESLI
ncbi:MAG: hypothetical protein LBF22_13155 [Deltaproteobacteria bacterium]|jgi:hypothetical protein|nr:hypothetical protein [Deltaproteobacteria bacterium]